MKKISKKFITILITIVILVNFILNPVCFAGDAVAVVRDVIVAILGTFVGLMTWPIRLIALGLGYAIDAVAAGIAYVDGTIGSASEKIFITPFEILFNETAITNINFFDFTNVADSTVVYKIREAVAGWYYFMRLIAVAVLLVILVYVGIRMAITTIAEDKARYKKMLVDWAASLALVFLLQYIMVFLITLNEVLVNAMKIMSPNDELSKTINDIALTSLLPTIEGIGATVVFFLFIFQTFSILFTYINRMIRVAFLIIISPLITITYSLDKMGDGKAQALNTWLKEMLTAVLIQPFHCVIYMVFINIAIQLLSNPGDFGTSSMAAAVIAILCMLFIKDAEGIVRKIFELNGDDGASSVAAGTAVAMAALHKSKEIGQGVRKGVNYAKEKKPIQGMKSAIKGTRNTLQAAGRTIADKAKGRGGPGFAANRANVANENNAKAQARAQAKADKKDFQRYKKISDSKSKSRHKLTQEDTKSIEKRAQEIENAFKQKNPNASKEELAKASQDAKRQAAIEHVREKRKSGAYESRAIKGARGVARAYRSFKSSNIGKKLQKDFAAAVGVAVGGMALGGEDVFAAVTSGMAARNATDEFMKSSNSYIGTEAGNIANAMHVSSPQDIKNASQEYASGISKKKKDRTQEEAAQQLKAAGMSDAEIDAALAGVQAGLKKDPSADVNRLIADAIQKTTSDVDQQIQGAAQQAVEDFKQAILRVNLGETIQKGMEYGASEDTLVQSASVSIAENALNSTFNEGLQKDLQDMGKDLVRETLTETQIERKITVLQYNGVDVQQYISKMEQELSRIQSAHIPQEEKDNMKRNLETNINTMKSKVPQPTN